jgi:glycosyltransferase involved in cell wall biosynthesis
MKNYIGKYISRTNYMSEGAKKDKNNRIVSVIIPSKRKTFIRHCLASLERQTYPKELFEVIIVSPEPITIESLTSPSIRIRNIVDEKANQAVARNLAEKVAKGDILAFCDDDCILPPDWIKKAIRHFSDSDVATVGGPSIPPLKGVSLREAISGLLMMSFLGAGRHRKAYTPGSEVKARLCSPVEIICANMFVDRYKFREVGGFDGVVPQEEDRLNIKFMKRGYKLIYDPECFNIHHQRPWGLRSIKNIFWLMAGQGLLTAERHYPSSKWYLIPPLFVVGLTLGPFFPFAFLRELYIVLVLIYVITITSETLRLLFRFRKELGGFHRLIVVAVTLPLAFLIHHVVSGVGFLYGFIRRVMTGRGGGR